MCTENALGSQPAADEDHRHTDTWPGAGPGENHVLPEHVAWAERPGLQEGVGGGEGVPAAMPCACQSEGVITCSTSMPAPNPG
jgi:hypothetical protein